MRVLLYERSYRRLAEAIAARIPSLEPVLMADDGQLHLYGDVVTIEDARPVAAWASSELYVDGPARDFMIACLKSDSLRFVQSSAAGFDHPVFGMLVDRGIALANSDASAISIAEFVFSAVLDVFQPHAQRRRLQAEHSWTRTPFREVCGTTWVVVGMGHIGGALSTRVRAFGAEVIGVRRSPRGDEPVDQLCTPAELPALLGEADVVALCVPANADSEGMVDAGFLAAMKPDAVLVNIGRGALLDEDALLTSLDAGRPGTAILDVFQQEPLPDDSPLWDHPRVLVSAHNAANGDGFVRRNDALFLHNMARVAAGDAPERVVPPEVVKGTSGG